MSARTATSCRQWFVRGLIAAPDGPTSTAGDVDRLLALLDPDVVLRVDSGEPASSCEIRGAEAVARQALLWSRPDITPQRVLANGAAGVVGVRSARPFAVAGSIIEDGRIAELDILTDPRRLAQLDLRPAGSNHPGDEG